MVLKDILKAQYDRIMATCGSNNTYPEALESN